MKFYTYLWLREDGTPWYVGKGYGNRAYQRCKGHWAPKDTDKIEVQYWSDEGTALAYEIYQIDFWGRKDTGAGILHNMTDGGQGTSGSTNKSKIGQKDSEETKLKKSLWQKGKPKQIG